MSFKCSDQMKTYCDGCYFHPERVDAHMHTAEATIWGHPKKLAASIFFYYFFFNFYTSLKYFPRVMVKCLVHMCLHVWMWNHALVYMWLHWNLRKHCWQTPQDLAAVTLLSVTLLCYLHVLCPAADEQHLSSSLFSIFFFLAGTSILRFLKKVFVFSQREGFTRLNGYGVRQRCQCTQRG